jgi:hypothetical protein
MVIHIEGAMVPGAPILPEYLKADVYVPPHILHKHPACQHPVAVMVQTFIEEVGIPTVNRWARAAHNLGWNLSQKGPISNPPSSYPNSVPSSVGPGSAHYIFCGWPHGALAMLASPSDSSGISGELPASQGSDNYFSTDKSDAVVLALMDTTTEIMNLKEHLQLMSVSKISRFKLQISRTSCHKFSTCCASRRFICWTLACPWLLPLLHHLHLKKCHQSRVFYSSH